MRRTARPVPFLPPGDIQGKNMPVQTFPLGPLETNCHIVSNKVDAVVIDPGGDPKPVLAFLEKHHLKLQAILVTHLHFDHLYGVAALHKSTDAPVMVPPADAHLLGSEFGSGGVWGFPKVENFESTPLKAGELTLGSLRCTVLDTPGHTPGSVSFYFPDEEAACTGDLLFYRSIGRTDFPGGDLDTLLHSVRQQIFTLPGKTDVFPGHGLATTVDDEKNNNPYCGAFVR